MPASEEQPEEAPMRTVTTAIAALFVSVMCMAGTALAGSSYPPSPRSHTVVKGAGPGSTAFTGGNLSAVGVAVVVLVAIGVIAFIAARSWPQKKEV
jgi:hypothetical protein